MNLYSGYHGNKKEHSFNPENKELEKIYRSDVKYNLVYLILFLRKRDILNYVVAYLYKVNVQRNKFNLILIDVWH